MEKQKLYTSCNTDYIGCRDSWVFIEQIIRNLAEAGFTHAQWMQDWQGEYIYAPSEMRYIRDLFHDYRIIPHAIHASEGGIRTHMVNGKRIYDNRTRMTELRKDYTSCNEYARLAGVDMLKNSIQLCSCIGADVMVLHMQLPYQTFVEHPEEKTAYYRQVFKSLDELKGFAVGSGVRIAFENLIGTPQSFQDEQFDMLFDRYPPEFLGFCWDSGHSSLMCRKDPYHFLKKYHSRLCSTHLQDNESIPDEDLYNPDPVEADYQVTEHDTHWIPNVDGSLGRGMLDWNRIADLIATSPLELPACFEVAFHGGDIPAQLRLCHTQAEKFMQMLLDRRAAAKEKVSGQC